MSPRVSVCVPTYNRAGALKKTIESLLGQTYNDWEMIVCDDASQDDTKEVIRSIKDDRIRYFRNESNLGLYQNWNRCLEIASGEFVAIYHDHDIYLPHILERSVLKLDRHPGAVMVHTASLIIDDDNELIGVDARHLAKYCEGDVMRKMIAKSYASPVLAATVMVRRDAYQNVGGYNFSDYGLGCDLDMWFRLSLKGGCCYIKEPQVLIRARTKIDDTAQFVWQDVLGLLKMRDKHIDYVFGPSRNIDKYVNQTHYYFERNYFLAMLMARAILLEPSSVVEEGNAILKKYANTIVSLLAICMKKSKVFRNIVKKTMLPLHYKKVNHYQCSKRQELDEYCRVNGYPEGYYSLCQKDG